MIQPASEFEILRSLHTLWVRGGLTSSAIKILLKNHCELILISITDDEIKAESIDGTAKYRIGQ
jgi:hypothetical protein